VSSSHAGSLSSSQLHHLAVSSIDDIDRTSASNLGTLFKTRDLCHYRLI